jgi:hypothetical protein
VFRIDEIENEFPAGNDLTEGASTPADEVVVGEANAVAVEVVHLEHQVLLLLEEVRHVRPEDLNGFRQVRLRQIANDHFSKE